MGEIISFAAYRKKKGIAAPRSPYYTLKATDEQIQDALQLAAKLWQIFKTALESHSMPC